MKKKVLFFMAVFAISAIGLITYAKTTASPECLNGCLPCGDLCVCNGDYAGLLEGPPASQTLEQR